MERFKILSNHLKKYMYFSFDNISESFDMRPTKHPLSLGLVLQ